jgi:hypothetical protein
LVSGAKLADPKHSLACYKTGLRLTKHCDNITFMVFEQSSEYKQWLSDLKSRIRQSQIKATVKVNTELLLLYWDLGQDILIRYQLGDEIQHQPGAELHVLENKGNPIRQQVADELESHPIFQIPWRHHLEEELRKM